MKPSKLNREQALKVVKTLLYVGVSAILGAAVAFTTDQPEMFGIYTPVINVMLVTLKQIFTETK